MIELRWKSVDGEIPEHAMVESVDIDFEGEYIETSYAVLQYRERMLVPTDNKAEWLDSGWMDVGIANEDMK